MATVWADDKRNNSASYPALVEPYRVTAFGKMAVCILGGVADMLAVDRESPVEGDSGFAYASDEIKSNLKSICKSQVSVLQILGFLKFGL